MLRVTTIPRGNVDRLATVLAYCIVVPAVIAMGAIALVAYACRHLVGTSWFELPAPPSDTPFTPEAEPRGADAKPTSRPD
jgi:hypothetical protein